MIRRPPRSTLSSSSAASDVYKRQVGEHDVADPLQCLQQVVPRLAGFEVVPGGVAGRGGLTDREREPGRVLERAHAGTRRDGDLVMVKASLWIEMTRSSCRTTPATACL